MIICKCSIIPGIPEFIGLDSSPDSLKLIQIEPENLSPSGLSYLETFLFTSQQKQSAPYCQDLIDPHKNVHIGTNFDHIQ